MSASPTLLFSTAAFFQQPLREGMRAIADAGYTAAEVMVTKDPATQDAGTIDALAREYGIEIRAVHAPFLLISRRVFGTDPVGKITRSVELAHDVGAGVVVVHPPYRWQSDYRRWLGEDLPTFAHREGVRVGIENMFPMRLPGERAITFHAGQGLEHLATFDHVVLDTSHAAVAGIDLLHAAERLGDRLAHVHLSNNAGRGWDSHLPVDEGVLPMEAFLATLRRQGFSGNVSLELDIRSGLSDTRATRETLIRQREYCEVHLADTPATRTSRA